jgi:hypothetical protein
MITELAGLVGVETQERDFGVVDVVIAGLPAVVGSITMFLEESLQDRSLQVFFKRGESQQGGRLGLLTRKTVARINLDTLARTVVNEVNRYHVQGGRKDR